MDDKEHHFYEFGPFRLDATEGVLLRGGEPVRLTPKALKLLLVLVRNSGHILDKDALMSEVWPDAIVEETNLAGNIYALRQTLGYGKDEHVYIETIPKRGYRFIARVRELPDKSPVTMGQGSPGVSVRLDESIDESAGSKGTVIGSPMGEINRYRRTVVFGLATLVIAGIGIFFGWSKFAVQRRASLKPVAPFQTMKIIRLTNGGKASEAAISRDGKFVVHVGEDAGKRNLWVRQVATTSDVQIVPAANVDYLGLTFSNDGNYIYYVEGKSSTERGLYQVPALGGVPKKVLVDIRTPVTFSPDGKKFAFVRVTQNEEEGLLMIANADGSGEQKLAARGGYDWFSYSGPAWSPDGKVIASGAGSPRGMTVVTVGVEDGAQREFTSKMWSNVETVAWLADGSGLVLNAADRGTRFKQLWHLSYPDGEARQITNDLNDYKKISLAPDSATLITVAQETSSNISIASMGHAGVAKHVTTNRSDGRYGLSWTPDDRIVYVSDSGGNLDIWITDQDGTNQTQLTTNPWMDRKPSVSPDGRYIVFISDREGSPNIWRMDMDGNNPKKLTSGIADVNPYCSSDGRWVVYSSYTVSGKQVVFKVPIDGGDPVQLTDKLSPGPSVSPDGKLIACFYLDETHNSPWRIMVIPFEGGQPVKRFEIPTTVDPWKEVRWAADGRALTYIDTRGGVSNIWSQPLTGGPPKQVTNFATDQLHHFDLSRDGKRLALARGIVISDVVMISDQKVGVR